VPTLCPPALHAPNDLPAPMVEHSAPSLQPNGMGQGAH
jgi:hypothetical protein